MKNTETYLKQKKETLALNKGYKQEIWQFRYEFHLTTLFLFCHFINIFNYGFCSSGFCEMTAVLIPSADMSQPDFSGIKFITLKYSREAQYLNYLMAKVNM